VAGRELSFEDGRGAFVVGAGAVEVTLLAQDVAVVEGAGGPTWTPQTFFPIAMNVLTLHTASMMLLLKEGGSMAGGGAWRASFRGPGNGCHHLRSSRYGGRRGGSAAPVGNHAQ
jgi:hypothetical protein